MIVGRGSLSWLIVRDLAARLPVMVLPRWLKSRTQPVVFASMALVPIIVGEELVWRGVVQATQVQRRGVWRGVALAAVVYAQVHVPLASPVLVAAGFVCGLAWGTLRAMTASLVPALVAHLLWNMVVLVWLPLYVP